MRQWPKSFSRHFLQLGLVSPVLQQAGPLLRHKVYHILDAKSLVSTAARGDSEDKCSFPEWFIMLRLHYLAFGGWQQTSPAPPHLYFNPTLNDIPEVLFRRQSILHIGNNSFIHVLGYIFRQYSDAVESSFYRASRFALTVMVFVNYGGGGYWFFQHAPWNGKANMYIFKDLQEYGTNWTVQHANLNVWVRVFFEELTCDLLVMIKVKSTPTGSHSS